jgi:hypothetical protein
MFWATAAAVCSDLALKPPGLYNPNSLRVDLMRNNGIKQVEGRRAPLRWALTSVVLFSLVVTLATRFQVTVQDTPTVCSVASKAMRQHMNRDAVRWAAPILQLALQQAPTFCPRVAPAGPPIPTLLIEENLYNRPPPSC